MRTCLHVRRYISRLFSWIDGLLNDESVFPTEQVSRGVGHGQARSALALSNIWMPLCRPLARPFLWHFTSECGHLCTYSHTRRKITFQKIFTIRSPRSVAFNRPPPIVPTHTRTDTGVPAVISRVRPYLLRPLRRDRAGRTCTFVRPTRSHSHVRCDACTQEAQPHINSCLKHFALFVDVRICGQLCSGTRHSLMLAVHNRSLTSCATRIYSR